VAIATIERDPARDTGTPELRFRLQQELCRSNGASFWRAFDRRSGKSCVVRVGDADGDTSSRRLGDLHRERTLAERIGHAGVLRTDVPLVEAGRIFQVVDPEPARVVAPEAEGGRLGVLQLLTAVSAVLAEAHGHGAFHGAFSRESCLRTPEGRVLVHGFIGDAAAVAAAREGAAADHRAFLEFATEMLRATGGPPPRLRRYFAQHLSDTPPRPAIHAMAELCTELRESLEDTFPWPVAAAADAQAAFPAPDASAIKRTATREKAAPSAPPLPVEVVRPEAASDSDKDSGNDWASGAGKDTPAAAASVVTAAPARDSRPTRPPAGKVAISTTAVVRDKDKRSEMAPVPARDGLADVAAIQAPKMPAEPVKATRGTAPTRTAARASAPVVDEPPSRRSWRPWVAALVVSIVIAVTLQFASKSRTGALPTPPASPPASRAPAAASLDAAPAPEAATAAAPESLPPAIRDAPAVRSARPGTEPPAAARATAAVTAPSTSSAKVRQPLAVATRKAAVAPLVPIAPRDTQDEVPSPQAVRSRVATLVAGGNRALNTLEPGAASGAFAEALALSPDDAAAREGSQRARRLEGVAALLRDAREATARGDHARAVQGYAQALANDPRNRGLTEALATARRSLGRDATGALLADGHAALGKGHFEEAQAAFEQALAADPQAPGARQAAEQASRAILLRDQAEARRVAATDPRQN
jgi:hypothetical protein